MRVRLLRDARGADEKKRRRRSRSSSSWARRARSWRSSAEPGPAQELARQAFFELMNPKASTESLPEAKDAKAAPAARTSSRRSDRRVAQSARRSSSRSRSRRAGPLPGRARRARTSLAKNVVTSDGVVVTSACTPTGPELCFNANDDNCNGVIDEGCGVGTGVLQFMVAWGDSPADVDISRHRPERREGPQVEPLDAAPGLQLEKNCPEDGCHGQNVENVFFEGNEPPRGKYIVEVKLVDPHGAELPVRAHLSARVGNRTFAMDLTLAPGGARRSRASRSSSEPPPRRGARVDGESERGCLRRPHRRERTGAGLGVRGERARAPDGASVMKRPAPAVGAGRRGAGVARALASAALAVAAHPSGSIASAAVRPRSRPRHGSRVGVAVGVAATGGAGLGAEPCG